MLAFSDDLVKQWAKICTFVAEIRIIRVNTGFVRTALPCELTQCFDRLTRQWHLDLFDSPLSYSHWFIWFRGRSKGQGCGWKPSQRKCDDAFPAAGLLHSSAGEETQYYWWQSANLPESLSIFGRSILSSGCNNLWIMHVAGMEAANVPIHGPLTRQHDLSYVKNYDAIIESCN